MFRASLVASVLLALPGAASAAESVMVQCGQQYQAAKAGGTLNGQTWNQFRTDCAARLKAQPAVATAPAPAATPPVETTAAAAAAPAAATPQPAAAAPATTAPAVPAAAKPVSAGRAAMLTREKQCGAEWRAQKATLVAQTPGLTWPKYWSQCNTRLKAAGK